MFKNLRVIFLHFGLKIVIVIRICILFTSSLTSILPPPQKKINQIRTSNSLQFFYNFLTQQSYHDF